MLSTMENMRLNDAPANDAGAKEARAILDAVRDIERSVVEPPVPWTALVASGLFLGLAVACQLQEMGLQFFAAFAAAMVIAVVSEVRAKPAVRTAVKQGIEPDPQWSWKRFLAFVAVYAAATGALQVLPRGNLAVSLAAGAVAALAWILVLGLNWQRWHR